jgi:hypothetical protein
LSSVCEEEGCFLFNHFFEGWPKLINLVERGMRKGYKKKD